MLPTVNAIQTQQGRYLLMASPDHINNALYTTGEWESHIVWIVTQLTRDVDEPVVIDVGANLGAITVPVASAIAERGGSVLAIEAQRLIYYQLCGNIFLNGLDNVHALNVAVGAQQGTLEIEELDLSRAQNVGGFSLDDRWRNRDGRAAAEWPSSGRSTTVQMIKLDDLGISPAPAVIKVDVEGLELDVLRGALKLLASAAYPPLLLEAWREAYFVQQRAELIGFVTDLGYEVIEMGEDIIAQHPAHPSPRRLVAEGGSLRLVERSYAHSAVS